MKLKSSALLGYYREWNGNSLLMFRDNLLVSSKVNKSKKKGTCRFWWWLTIRCDSRIVGKGVFWSLQCRRGEQCKEFCSLDFKSFKFLDVMQSSLPIQAN